MTYEKFKHLAEHPQHQDVPILTLTMRHPSWIFLFFGGRIVTFAPV